MKILHVLDHSLPLHSGYTFRSANLFREQLKRGWLPVVVTSPKHEASWKGPWSERETIHGICYHRSGPLTPHPSTCYSRLPDSRLPDSPLHDSRFTTSRLHDLTSQLLLIHRLSQRIRQVAAAERPDLLHAHSPVLNALAALRAGRWLGLPVVYEIRAFWEDAAVDHGTTGEGSLRYRFTRALETWACRRVDHVAVLCHGIRGDLIRRGIPSDKITPVFNGVDTEAFGSVPPDEELRELWGLRGKTVIGFIGSFYRYEGLDLLVEAFARLAREREDVRLVLVGGGETAEELRGIAAAKGVEGSVVMPGRIPHEKVPGVYALTDILAYPRYPMRLTDLVTPLKPLEAMAMGKALVASDVGGHREQVQHGRTGLLFEAGNAEALHRALSQLAADPGLRERLGRCGRDWVEAERTWQHTTEAYVSMYSKALHRRHRP